jgi:hypothetical protein
MDDPLVTVATFGTPLEAELARNRLEEQGIAAVVADAETVGTLWSMGAALGGVKVQVKESDLGEARLILASRPGRVSGPADDYGLEERVQEGSRPRLRQRRVREEDEEAAESESDATAARAWKAAVVGLLFPFLLLHLYSAWLLFQLPWTRGPLSPAGRRKALAAAVLDFLGFVAVILLLRSLAVPPPTRPWRPLPDF